MAMIILDKSECVLCGKILTKDDDIVALPPVSPKDNPLYKYFDAGAHKTCFDNWDKKKSSQGNYRQTTRGMAKFRRV